jgi:hypothetical protein
MRSIENLCQFQRLNEQPDLMHSKRTEVGTWQRPAKYQLDVNLINKNPWQVSKEYSRRTSILTVDNGQAVAAAEEKCEEFCCYLRTRCSAGA